MDYIFKLSIPESTCSLSFKAVSQLSIKLVYSKLGLLSLPQVGSYLVVGGFPCDMFKERYLVYYCSITIDFSYYGKFANESL